ncbi:MAG: hypothetical protein ACLS3F_10995 [Oscillospiraceae bacterium]
MAERIIDGELRLAREKGMAQVTANICDFNHQSREMFPRRGVPAHRRRVVCAPALNQKRKQASGFPYTKKLFCQRQNSFFYVIHSLPARCGSSRTG